MRIEAREIKIVPIESIVFNPKNRNIHTERQIEVLAKIITARGFRTPVTISKRSGFLVAGHARVKAAMVAEYKEVPVIFQDFENEAEEYAHLVADNEIARHAIFDKQGFQDDLVALDLDIQAIDLEGFGLLDFGLPAFDKMDIPEEENSQVKKKYSIEIFFPNEMEMMDINDDLTHRGYLVKIK